MEPIKVFRVTRAIPTVYFKESTLALSENCDTTFLYQYLGLCPFVLLSVLMQ